MRIIIDADACPSIDDIISLAKKYSIQCHLFFDNSHNLIKEEAICHILDIGSQAVDIAIQNEIKKDDILITSDYGLAAVSLSICKVISPNGTSYSNKDIEIKLLIRHDNKKRRDMGYRIKGPKKRKKKQVEQLLMTLETLINQ